MALPFSSTPSGASAVVVRILPPEEYPRLLSQENLQTPFAAYGLPRGDGWRIIVAEVDGEIVGLSCLYDCVHWDGWWFRPEHRGNPSAIRQMLRVGRDILQEAGVRGVFAQVEDTQPASYREMIGRLGFRSTNARLYLLATEDFPKGL